MKYAIYTVLGNRLESDAKNIFRWTLEKGLECTGRSRLSSWGLACRKEGFLGADNWCIHYVRVWDAYKLECLIQVPAPPLLMQLERRWWLKLLASIWSSLLSFCVCVACHSSKNQSQPKMPMCDPEIVKEAQNAEQVPPAYRQSWWVCHTLKGLEQTRTTNSLTEQSQHLKESIQMEP